MLGTWQVTNKLSAFSMPLGRALVDSFVQAVAQEDVAEAVSYAYQLKFVPVQAPLGEPTLRVAQDRRFNAIEETQAFLGADGGTVRECTYECCSDSAPHGRLHLEVLDPPDELGGAAASANAGRATMSSPSSFLDLQFVWAQWDAQAEGVFITSELVEQRTQRAADLYSDAQDETQYLEIITRFARRGPDRVVARNRLVQYLTLPGRGEAKDRRAALAAGRAVSFFDYDWELERIPSRDASSLLGTPRRA